MINRFSQLFKEIERDIGTRDLNLLVLKSFRDAIDYYKGDTVEKLYAQMKEVMRIVNNTEPKFSIIIDNCFNVFEEMHSCVIDAEKCHKHQFNRYKSCLLQSINRLIRKSAMDWKQLMIHAEAIDASGKTILIHDHSHTVHDALAHLKKHGQKFKVIVAEQDIEKTLSNIEFLSENKIPFQTVPDYMLSNVMDEIDLGLFGALTFKSTYDFVTSNGVHAVTSQLHLLKKPVYMLMTTSKFALWKAQKKAVVQRHSQTRKHPLKDLTFERFKFSHDRVPLENVSFTVTEEGILSARQMQNVYKRKFEEHKVITSRLTDI